MPILTQTTEGTVTGLRGSAQIRGADGEMKRLNEGDVVRKGDQILTTDDGYVEITPSSGSPVEQKASPPPAPPKARPASQSRSRDSISNDHLKHHNICLMPNTRSKSTPNYFVTQEPYFAQPRHGNKAKFFVTGADTMQAMADAIRGATEFIFFVDWQMDYDVELTDRRDPTHPSRLTELLAKQLDKHPKLDIYILLYDSIESPAYTHENEVREFAERLNNRWQKPAEGEVQKGKGPPMDARKRVQVVVHPPNTGRDAENIGFSHHQKMIVVDGKIGFIGGIDVTYGRWDDGNFDVVADPVKHRINDMYNPGLGKGRLLTQVEADLTKEFLGKEVPAGYTGRNRPGFALTYYLATILYARIQVLWEQGRTLEEIQRVVEMSELPGTAKKQAIKKYEALEKKLLAVQAIYDEYSKEKDLAAKEIMEGKVAQGEARAAAANKKLRELAAKKIGDKLTAMKKSIQEGVKERWEATKHSLKKKGEDIAYYAEDPSRIVDDAQVMWEEIKDLPNYLANNHALEEGCQPRMPWQDVHSKLSGPIVFDMYKNFVRRWNTCYEMRDNEGSTPLTDAWLAGHGGRSIFGNLHLPADTPGVSIQIVRSMSRPQLEVEWSKISLHNTMDFETSDPKYAVQLKDHKKSVTRHDDGIQFAMSNCIKAAEAYIYIETQFFISQAGKSDKGEDHPATNGIVNALAARIGEKIAVGQDFHVYIVLPVHPEGSIMAGPVAKQHYWILQSLKHGESSLIRRICEFLVMKENGGQPPSKAQVDDKIRAEAWTPYLTVLNLRNYGFTMLCERDKKGERIKEKELGRFVITEQCYIHSKLLIVDDAVVVLGSANVNDRSLNGNGDSEIAAVIVDNDKIDCVDLGNGVPVTTRKFARELREKLWKKHFGMLINDRQITSQSARPPGFTTGRDPADGPPPNVKISLPAAPSTVKAIQAAASKNATIYEEVFRHTPRNSMRKFEETTLAWPKRWSKTGAGAKAVKTVGIVTGVAAVNPGVVLLSLGFSGPEAVTPDFAAEPPELQPKFMMDMRPGIARHYAKKEHNLVAANNALKEVKGYFVLMPLDFGLEEKNTWLGGKKGDFIISHRGTDADKHLGLAASQDAIGHQA